MQIFPQKIGVPGKMGVPGESGVSISNARRKELTDVVCKDCIVKMCCYVRCSTYFVLYMIMINKIKRGELI